MSPLPELNLNLSTIKDSVSFNNHSDEHEVSVRTDSAFVKHTIKMVITEEEIGSVVLTIGQQEINLPTYKLMVANDKTNETKVFQVTRDVLKLVEIKRKKSLLSYLGFKKFDKNIYIYDVLMVDNQKNDIEIFEISRHRKLNENTVRYEFDKMEQKAMVYAGDLQSLQQFDTVDHYFVITDDKNGKTFISYIHFLEKELLLTPHVELQMVRRKKVPKNFEVDHKGNIMKVVYI